MNENNNIEEMEIDLKELFMVIWKKKFILIAVVAVSMVATFLFANTLEPEFQASTQVLVSEDEEQLREYISEGRTLTSSRNTDLYIEIMKSSNFLENMRAKLDINPELNEELTPRRLRNMINISSASINNLLVIEVTHNDPELATDIANKTAVTLEETTYDRQVSDFDRALNFISEQLEENQRVILELEDKIAEANGESTTLLSNDISIEENDYLASFDTGISDINGEISLAFLESEKDIAQNTYDMLRERQEEIRLQKNIQPTEIEVIEAATIPENPVSPRVNLMTLISGVLAGMLGLFVIFMFEFFDTRIKTEEQLEKVSDLPVLGIIPEIDVDKHSKENQEGDN